MHKLILAAASVAALALIGPASAADSPIVLKFIHVVASDTPKGKAADKFKARYATFGFEENARIDDARHAAHQIGAVDLDPVRQDEQGAQLGTR